MIKFIKWLGKRLTCTILGHELKRAKVYWAIAKSIEDGYRCERCGKEQIILWRWQDVE